MKSNHLWHSTSCWQQPLLRWSSFIFTQEMPMVFPSSQSTEYSEYSMQWCSIQHETVHRNPSSVVLKICYCIQIYAKLINNVVTPKWGSEASIGFTGSLSYPAPAAYGRRQCCIHTRERTCSYRAHLLHLQHPLYPMFHLWRIGYLIEGKGDQNSKLTLVLNKKIYVFCSLRYI